MRTRLLSLLLAAGCGSDDVMVITVDKRPAVVDARTLHVTLSNAGAMREQTFELAGETFPTTFGVRLGERTGELAISIEALDEANVVLGRGEAVAAVDAAEPAVMLEAQDFIVNTDRARPHGLAALQRSVGFQLAAESDAWTAVFRVPDTMFARRFDLTGQPRAAAAAPGGGTDQFPLSMAITSTTATPAVATSVLAGIAVTIAVWDDDEPAQAGGIQCRALVANGALGELQLQVALDESPATVSAAALPDGNFVVAWDGRAPAAMNRRIRRVLVDRSCQPLGSAIDVSEQGVAPTSAERGHVAANATRILHVWKLNNVVRVRASDHAGNFATPDKELFAVPANTGEALQFVRIAPLADGFAVLVRRTNGDDNAPGRIELLRTTADGDLVGAPELVTDRSDSDFSSIESFGVASRPDGHLLVVWGACINGDGAGCGVFGQLIGPTGQRAGAAFSLATTTANHQLGPSAVALSDGSFATMWTESGPDPLPSEGTIRARIVYPAP